MKKLENKDQIELYEFRSWAYDDDSCAIDKLYEIAEPLLSIALCAIMNMITIT